LNLTEGYTYLSSNKSSPGVTEGSNNDAWNFKGFAFSSSSKNISLDDINIYWESSAAVKCIFDTSSNIVLNISQNDFVQNYQYPVSIYRKNLAVFAWKVNGNVLNTKDISVTFSITGCNTIELWAKNAAGQTMYNCRNIYVSPLFGSDGSTNTVAIKETNPKISAVRMIYLFWNRGNAPIAPKKTGGFYMLYTENPNNNTYVDEFDTNLNRISHNKLNFLAFPMDIVAEDNGFSVYVKDCIDNNKAWVVAYDSSYNLVGQKIIMNNGITPSQITQQTTFYDNNGKVLGGLNAMFAASSGKLSYGRGRYGLIFAHYNAFGTPSARDDHQGDTFYSFDRSQSSYTYAWSWKTSHSLQQTQIYTGRYYLTASLGDVYPENIRVCIIDQTSFTSVYDSVNKGYNQHPTQCIDIVKGKICGDGGGGTCGRIGGLVQLGDTFGLVYARKSCSFSGYGGTPTSSSDSEIGLITFQINNFNFINLKYYTYGNADYITAIRAGKYGSNIFITYLQITTSSGSKPQQNYIFGDKTIETQYTLLVDFNGNVILPATTSSGNISVSPSDEIRFLSDGTPIWSYVDSNNNLLIYTLPTPPKMNNINTAGTLDSIIIASSGSSDSSGSSSSSGSTNGSGSSGSSSNANFCVIKTVYLIILFFLFI